MIMKFFLTQKEFDLLLFLVENPNRVFSKEELFERVWGGYDSLSDASTITVHIARIREKKLKLILKGVHLLKLYGGVQDIDLKYKLIFL